MAANLRILAGITAAAALAAGIQLSTRGGGRTEERRTSPAASLPRIPGESLRTDWPAEDVFRRAFWRHPQADDEIIEAVRTESSGADGVNRWVWFMKIHPSAALLRDLRNQDTFGLVPVDRPKAFLPDDISAPAWFSPPGKASGVEVLQHPSQGLTVRYQAGENLLYVSDHGRGFSKGLRQ